ncbi:predicted protein [Chaetomium globosum CBS 148.51]|uniref:Uncharacterized protein n=1 Tax=Chaetomium globosum (strain ATCC 6205 / CBS 148.51 / DSM 1962 / NBRC 6347 / NRRL 1970) TaxID=306901 RepID=Q2HE56_CHAGB|nr:uncharacterized protein CHGG_01498 [Chaetomium globosum CBS 148.51]EAQ93263.1 predicted protein [Chaetomium globosum CBS 148.51]
MPNPSLARPARHRRLPRSRVPSRSTVNSPHSSGYSARPTCSTVFEGMGCTWLTSVKITPPVTCSGGALEEKRPFAVPLKRGHHEWGQTRYHGGTFRGSRREQRALPSNDAPAAGRNRWLTGGRSIAKDKGASALSVGGGGAVQFPTCLIGTRRGHEVGGLEHPPFEHVGQAEVPTRPSIPCRRGNKHANIQFLTKKGVAVWIPPPPATLVPESPSRRSQIMGPNSAPGYPVLSVANGGIDPSGFIPGCGPRGRSAMTRARTVEHARFSGIGKAMMTARTLRTDCRCAGISARVHLRRWDEGTGSPQGRICRLIFKACGGAPRTSGS